MLPHAARSGKVNRWGYAESPYRTAINAAFLTPGVRNFTINGAWRPHPDDYEAIKNKRSPLPNPRSAHISSRALDINMINGRPINNGGYVDHRPGSQEPKLIGSFTDNLLDQPGVRQIFQPWRMWQNTQYDSVVNVDAIMGSNGKWVVNANGKLAINDNAVLHRNHLHFGF